MNRDEYDTISGITLSLGSYEKFNEMLDERRKAGYKRKERLNEFVILGRFWLDTCGNVGSASNFIPAEHIPNFPSVVKMDLLWEIIMKWQKEKQPDVLTSEEIDAPDFSYAKNKRPFPIGVSWSMSNNIPPARILCQHCLKGWKVETCHDVIRKSTGSKSKSEKPKVGKTISEIRKEFRERTDAEYFLSNFITNEKHIDLTPKEKYPSLKKNQNGCLDVKDDYVIVEGDNIHYDVHHYYHKECLIAKTEKDCEEHLKNEGKDYHQGNLAGLIECDSYIKLELNLTGIPIVDAKTRGEVPYHYEGKLNDFKFRRAWYYWVVSGLVPLELAKEMYENPIGKKDVRVAGHCGCPAPEPPWTTETEDGSFVESYHIDSWQGLKLFVNTIKKGV